MRTTEDRLNYVRTHLEEIYYNYLTPGELDDRGRQIFKNLWRLDESDRKTIILYAELRSSRMVGEVLGVSHQTVLNRVREIKKKLKGL